MINLKKHLPIACIVLIAAVIRFYHLGQNPPSLYWDEVALGYNAYSIAETGKDEEGSFLPIQYIRSFGDFKPPVYVYAAVPAIKLLGLNEWTTRFPSAFFGTLSVLLTYLITKQLLYRVQKSHEQTFFINTRIEYIALAAALLLALSPWHTQISRVAYEANVAHFLVLLGIWSFFKTLHTTKHKILFALLSGLSFMLTLYTFNSNRVFTPLLVGALGIIYIKEITAKAAHNFKPLLIAAVVAAILSVPALQHMFSREGQLRYKEVNIFSNAEVIELANQRIQNAGSTPLAKLLNNRRVLFAQNWLDGYFRHFSGRFLFISGDVNPRFSLQDVGELYLIELPFLLIGLYLMLSRPNREYAFVLVWMLLAPIPAAFAREVPHALRSLNILPTFQIIAALGFIYAAFKLRHASHLQTILPKALLVLSVLLLTAQLYYFQHNYYTHYPQFTESEWQYGYKQMVQKLTQIDSRYDKVVITDGRGRPYINVLFYKQYSPAQFQQERQAVTDETGFGFINVTGFNKYQFHGINWKQEIANQKADQKTLLVGVPGELEENKYTQAVIKNLKGETVFIMNEVPQGLDALYELGYTTGQ